MKKLLAILLAVMLLIAMIALTGCGNMSVGIGNFVFQKIHVDTYHYSVCFTVEKWRNGDTGIEVKTREAGFTWKHGKAAQRVYGRKAVAAPAGVVCVQKDDQLAINAKKIKPIKGFSDVVVHGDQTGFYMYASKGNESSFTPLEFAEIVRTSKSYKGGAIRLISCDTAADGAIAAQELADVLSVDIMAPKNAVFVDFLGEMTVGSAPFTNDGKWVILKPRR